MDQELKTKWLEALRSGKYTQTRGALCRTAPEMGHPAGMCCLGVLCDVIDPSRWIELPYANVKGYGDEVITSYLPHDLEPLLGSHEMILAGRNDDGDSFLEIADYIEANL